MGDRRSSSSKFPAADVHGALNPGRQTEFEVDSVSSEIAKGNKEVIFPKNSEKKTCCGKEKKGSCPNKGVMKTFMVSGVIMALAAAAFVVSKKMQNSQRSR